MFSIDRCYLKSRALQPIADALLLNTLDAAATLVRNELSAQIRKFEPRIIQRPPIVDASARAVGGDFIPARMTTDEGGARGADNGSSQSRRKKSAKPLQ